MGVAGVVLDGALLVIVVVIFLEIEVFVLLDHFARSGNITDYFGHD